MEDHLDIIDDETVIAACRNGRILASELGFPPVEQAMVAAVISELARNILTYAGHGELQIDAIEDDDRRGIAIVARDRGPGITNLTTELPVSLSFSSHLGLGLKGVKGLTDSVEIHTTPGKGMTVSVRKWIP